VTRKVGQHEGPIGAQLPGEAAPAASGLREAVQQEERAGRHRLPSVDPGNRVAHLQRQAGHVR